MGRQLLAQEPAFRAALERCEEALQPYWSGRSVVSALAGATLSAEELEQTAVAQPLLFALQVALARTWQAWGIEPSAIVGHSLGEVAAAHIAGALELSDAARIVASRAALMQHAGVSEGAFHTGDTCKDLRTLSPGIRARPPMVPLYSATSGKILDGTELHPEYYGCGVEKPDGVSDAARLLARDGHRLYLVLGRPSTLRSAIQVAIEDIGGSRGVPEASLFLPHLTGDVANDSRSALLESLARLYAWGQAVVWNQVYPVARQIVTVPSYPWQHERFWLDRHSPGRPNYDVQGGFGHSQRRTHPLLSKCLNQSRQPANYTWEIELSPSLLPYLKDHRIGEAVILPAAVYVETVLSAASTVFGGGPYRVAEVSFSRPLILSDSACRAMRLVLSSEPAGVMTFMFDSRPSGSSLTRDAEEQDLIWTTHASGKIHLTDAHESRMDANDARCSLPDSRTLEDVRTASLGAVSADAFYQALAARGVQYGPSFRILATLWSANDEAIAELRPLHSEEMQADGYCINPALLDGCFQVLAAVLPTVEAHHGDMEAGAWVPVELGSFRVLAQATRDLFGYARLTGGSGERTSSRSDIVEGDVFLLSREGRIIVEGRGLRLARLGTLREHATTRQDIHQCLFQIRWDAKSESPLEQISARSAEAAWWLIFVDEGGLGKQLAECLEQRREKCVLVYPGRKYTARGSREYEIDIQSRAQFESLLGEALGNLGPHCRGVLHMWSLNIPRATGGNVQALVTAEELGCGSVVHLIQALAGEYRSKAPRLWLISRGAQALPTDSDEISIAQAPLIGLGRVVAREHPEFRCSLVDLDPVSESFSEAAALLHEISRNGTAEEVAFRGQPPIRYVPRLARYLELEEPSTPQVEESSSAGDRPFQLGMPRPGVLDKLRLQAAARRRPGRGEVEIEVKAAGMNFLDVLTALGVRPDGTADAPVQFGGECAGAIVDIGDCVDGFQIGSEVLAVAPASFASFTTTHSRFVAAKPSHLTFEEAATLPVAFITAVYALNYLGHLRRGERVLIHSAAGGVGLAAVQVARRAGAEIFATAGSPERRAYLRSIGITHVLNSRDLTFVQEVEERTGRKGVDLVLNSLAGEAIPKSLSLLAPYGRFIEIGKKDLYEDMQLGLRPFRRNLTYCAVDLSPMFQERPDTVEAVWREVMHGVETGEFQPLPARIFPIGEAVEAFSFMAQAKHIGKIVLSVAERDRATANIAPHAKSTGMLRPDATYLIAGGLGGLGMAVASWFIREGARHLVLLGRSGASPEAKLALESMRESGAQVMAVSADVAKADDVARVLADIRRNMPPLRGIIHSAAVLHDGILLHQDRTRFRVAMAPKVEGSWNLHQLTLDQPLDFFVLFSAGASVLGSPGQGNYAAGCAFQDALAHHRQRLGLPALSINWGPWSDVGLAATRGSRDHPAVRWSGSITPEQGLVALGRLLAARTAQIAVLPFNHAQWRSAVSESVELPTLLRSFADEWSRDTSARASKPVREQILAAEQSQRRALLEDHLKSQLAAVLRLAAPRIDSHVPLQSLGLDSLMALEWRNRLEESLGVSLSPTLAWTYPTVHELVSHLAPLIDAPLEADDSSSGDSPVHPLLSSMPDRKPMSFDGLLAQVERLTEEQTVKMLRDGVD
jgi:NADPH:quinone reductase-like Zn-dependent oxidoreductase/acyl transferase domain-containing protein/acyl carrier protein